MDKEKSPKSDGGYSEKELDQSANKLTDLNQVKAVNVFDSKKKKSKEKVILDSQHQ